MSLKTNSTDAPDRPPLRIAVIGSGISGLSCAWLLKQKHEVVLYERADRLGGHTNTVVANAATGPIAVDTGFIVFNEATYPNLIALFDHLGVASRATDMSFSVSLEEGRFEYAAPALFAQRRNMLRPRFWSMLSEVLRFYREAPAALATLEDPNLSLGAFLQRGRFSAAFRDDHLLPMAATTRSPPPSAAAAPMSTGSRRRWATAFGSAGTSRGCTGPARA